jgi:hypothetical protein
MRRRRQVVLAVSALTLTVSGLVACASLVVPDVDSSRRPAEAGVDSAAKDTGTDAPFVDPCAHTQPPPKPSVDDDAPTQLGPFSFAIRETHLVAPFGYDAGVFDGGLPPTRILGFDLDNGCTCEPDQHPLGQGSCLSPTKAQCDLEGGIDNQLPTILTTLSAAKPGADVDKLATVNERISAGDSAIVMTLSGYNGRANDQEVTMVFRGVARPARSPLKDDGGSCADAGERPPSSDLPEAGKYDPNRIPAWDGCDVWAETVVTPEIAGYVTNHMLVIVTDISVPVQVAGSTILVRSPRMTVMLVPDGNGGFTLEDGNFGGRAVANAVLNAVGTLSLTVGNPVCTDPTQRSLVQSLICTEVDIATTASEDYFVNASGSQVACTGLSMGFGFRAEKASVAGVTDAGGYTTCDEAGIVLACPK